MDQGGVRPDTSTSRCSGERQLVAPVHDIISFGEPIRRQGGAGAGADADSAFPTGAFQGAERGGDAPGFVPEHEVTPQSGGFFQLLLARPLAGLAQPEGCGAHARGDLDRGPLWSRRRLLRALLQGYTYAYQISDDNAQTYIAHKEDRDGADVTGQYSYVDPLGSLITVSYTAGPDGYLETRNVQEGFVSIRQASGSAPSAAPARPVAVVAPVQQQVSTASSSGDSDLVAKIISQLTPFIQQTVSTTLSSSSQSAIRQPAVAVTAAPARPVAAPVRAPVQAASSVQGVFGVAGQNNVRVETPNFNFNYDLQK